MSDEFLKKQSSMLAKYVENTLTKEEQELLNEFKTATGAKKEEMTQNPKIQQLITKIAIQLKNSFPTTSVISQEQYSQMDQWLRK